MKVLIVNGYANTDAGKEAFKKFVGITKKVSLLRPMLGLRVLAFLRHGGTHICHSGPEVNR